jgi:hypothetical protein
VWAAAAAVAGGAHEEDCRRTTVVWLGCAAVFIVLARSNLPHHAPVFAVGKSTMLTVLTGTESVAAAYEFTTLT